MKKVIFMGTPDFAVPVLDMLIHNYEVVLVVTQPDKMTGRKQILTPTPVKQKALEHNIRVYQPIKIKDEYDIVLNTKADIIITCAYGQFIPKVILDYPEFGCVNVHASLLPKYRGGAPIHQCLIDGCDKTGITIMYMDSKMDQGDIIANCEYKIEDTDNVGTLHDELSVLGAKLLKETLPAIFNRTNKRIKQDENEVTYAYNIKREQEHIDFNKPGKEILNQIRGLNPWPVANFLIEDLEYKVFEAYFIETEVKEASILVDIKKDAIGISCKNGIIYVTDIKPFGKKRMKVLDYLNGINKNELLNKRVK